jgi:hypothetical protein
MDGSRSPDRVATQVGNDFPDRGPGCGLERERANGPVSTSGRMAAWSAGRAEREQADGPIFASGRMAAWCVERRMRERAVGCFLIRAEF